MREALTSLFSFPRWFLRKTAGEDEGLAGTFKVRRNLHLLRRDLQIPAYQSSRSRPNLPQSVRFLNLSMNLTLKFVGKAQINVDLKKTFTVFKGKFFWFLLFEWNYLEASRPTLICLCWFVLKEKEEKGFECVTSGFDWRFRARFFGNTWFSFCFDALMLETESELVILSLVWSTLLYRSNFFTSFTLLLFPLTLWSALEFLASGEEFVPWIAEDSIQWWRFINESLRIDEFVDEFWFWNFLGI